jgi:hypothetical protein
MNPSTPGLVKMMAEQFSLMHPIVSGLSAPITHKSAGIMGHHQDLVSLTSFIPPPPDNP